MVPHLKNQTLRALLHHGRLRRRRLHGPLLRPAQPPPPRRRRHHPLHPPPQPRAFRHRPSHLRLRILRGLDGDRPPHPTAGEARADERGRRRRVRGGAAGLPRPLRRPHGGGGAVPPAAAGRDLHDARGHGGDEREELLDCVREVDELGVSRGLVGEHRVHAVDSQLDFQGLFHALGKGFLRGEV
ncbi:hypothetical protein C2S51_031804 [Perilla frutescens var. frutescens]|nr:hypothetical protein C2S51_031804 [Perilla frutescens var. frutescens]